MGPMRLRVCVIDEQFAMLAIPLRLVLRSFDETEDRLGLLEDDVHFFQGSVRSLGVEEIGDGENEGAVDYSEDNAEIKLLVLIG